MAIQVPRVEPVKLSESNQSQEAIARMKQLMQFFIQTGISQENISINKELSEMSTLVSAGAHAVNVDQINTLLDSIDREASDWEGAGGSNIVTDFSDTAKDVLNVRKKTMQLGNNFKKEWIRLENQLEGLYESPENWGDSDKPGVVLLNEMEEKLIGGLNYIDAGTRTMFKSKLKEAKLVSRGQTILTKLRSQYDLTSENMNEHFLGIGPREKAKAQEAIDYLSTGIIEGNTLTIASGIRSSQQRLSAGKADTMEKHAAQSSAKSSGSKRIISANNLYNTTFDQNVGSIASEYLQGTATREGGEFALASGKINIVGALSSKGFNLNTINQVKMQVLSQIKQLTVDTAFKGDAKKLLPEHHEGNRGAGYWTSLGKSGTGIMLDINDPKNMLVFDKKIRELDTWANSEMHQGTLPAKKYNKDMGFYGGNKKEQAAANILNGLVQLYQEIESARVMMTMMPLPYDPKQPLFSPLEYGYGAIQGSDIEGYSPSINR